MSPTPTFEKVPLVSLDGTRLLLHRWSAPEAVGAVLVVHGYAEHGARYREFAHNLAAEGISVSALDLRGHGESGGQRGHVTAFERYLDDVGVALHAMRGDLPISILGHSNGGLIVLDLLSRRQPEVVAAVVTNPFLDLAMPVPPAKLKVGKIAARLFPRLPIPSGLDPKGVSRDEAVVSAYARDALVFKTATAGWFAETQVAQARVRGMAQVGPPLLYIYSDADPIALPEANRALADRLASDTWLRRGELHEVLNELDRTRLHREIADWLKVHPPQGRA